MTKIHPGKKILLAILPYWDPLIPPVGIATLKGFLQKHGINNIKTVDVIVEKKFQDIYLSYFQTLEEFIPLDKRGNFYNMGHNVLQDHMMAAIHYKDEREYIDLVKALIYAEFFISLEDHQIIKLNQVIHDLFIELEKYFIHLLEQEKPDIVGLSAYKGTLPASMFVLRLIKKINPDIMTVMGGSIFSTTLTVDSPNYKLILEKTKDYIDKIIIGEGEILFHKLVRDELPDSRRVFSIREMNMQELDLSQAVLPDYSDFDIANYPYMPATGAIGCPYKCSFCNTAQYWGKYRKKNIKQLVNEMTELYEKYGNQLFYISDALINPIVTDLAKEMMERDITLYYDCFHRVDNATCNIDNTLLWRQGGLYRVRIGVESGSQKVLDLIGKKITIEQIKASLYALAEAGIKTTTYWVIGHPGETEEDFQLTLALLEELSDVVYQAEPTPLEYVYSGQANSKDWETKRKSALPEKASKEMLISYNWVLDCEPQRDVVVERICRFDILRRKLGIPNPYSLREHNMADKRWKKLHKNSVPALLEFKSSESFINEDKNFKESNIVTQTQIDDIMFNL
jgi:radical SAM superfamily enzyme YgiQ (UPF0313 family)